MGGRACRTVCTAWIKKLPREHEMARDAMGNNTRHGIGSWRGANSRDDSKWFLQSIGHEGLNNLLVAYEDKSAKAVCTFAYSAGPGHEPKLFQGITDVSIHSMCLRLLVNFK
jgi:hypothetical protein